VMTTTSKRICRRSHELKRPPRNLAEGFDPLLCILKTR